MNQYITVGLVCFIALVLTGCGEPSKSTASTTEAMDTDQGIQLPDLPADAPKVGTDIKTLVNSQEDGLQAIEGKPVNKIMWEDLVPKDFQADTLLVRYQDQINAIPEGSPEERALYEKILAELNNAPANPTLNNKVVRIPGFVAPLDEHNGMVSEFLLVPYFGSCIHSPPPPVNQTVLVKNIKQSIPMEKIYEAVWVTGHLKVEQMDTDLAKAGYLIQNANLEIYDPEKEKYGQEPEGEAGATSNETDS